MANGVNPTAVPRDIFVTGGSGFIGTVFVRHAVAEGHRVRVLTRSESSGERVRAAGAEPVIGNLLEPGPWLSRLLVGPIVTESLTCDACLSNARLRDSGFELRFPGLETGIPDVVASWQASGDRRPRPT